MSGAALDDLDVQALGLVVALVDGGVVAGELGLGHPLQLQLDRGQRRRRAAPSLAAGLPTPPPQPASASADRGGGEAESGPACPSADFGEPIGSSISRGSVRAGRGQVRRLVPGRQRLHEQRGAVEDEAEHDGAEHVRPGQRVVARRRGRGDRLAEAADRAAEVLGHQGRDDGQRRRDPQPGEHVRRRRRQGHRRAAAARASPRTPASGRGAPGRTWRSPRRVFT